MEHETFAQILWRRDAAIRPAGVVRPASTELGPHATGDTTGAIAPDDPRALDDPVHRPGHLGERSLFRGVFRAVNPARPARPVNSRLLASPFRRRLKGQVIGR
jgi:hypothetical protein